MIPTGSHCVWTLFLLEKIPIVLRLAGVCWANLETLDVRPKLRVAQVAPERNRQEFESCEEIHPSQRRPVACNMFGVHVAVKRP